MKALSEILAHLNRLGYETHDYLALLREELADQAEEDVEIEWSEALADEEEQQIFLAEQETETPSEIMILVFEHLQKIVFRVNLDPEKSVLAKPELYELFNLLNDAMRGAPKIFYDADRDEIAIETVWTGNFYRQRVFQRFFSELQEFCAVALSRIFLENEPGPESTAERLERLLKMDYEPGPDDPESLDS
jgi:hypothetical protein